MVSSRLRLLHFSICLRFAATPSPEINCFIIYANTFPKTKATCHNRGMFEVPQKGHVVSRVKEKKIYLYIHVL